jgi:N,N'-diacetyllegionaminate synthase
MTIIIAEVCQNHCGNRDILARAISESALAGADYIKTQIIFSEELTDRKRFEKGFVENNGVVKTIKRPYEPEITRLSSLDLSLEDYRWFIEESLKHRIKPMVTVFSRGRVDFAGNLPWTEKTVKVASYDCASYVFIRELCKYFDHLIISTGSTSDDEIAEAAKTVENEGRKLTLMHCVTSYPNSMDMCNLARIRWLRQFSDSVGWSDHSLVERDGLKASKIAILLGANIVERHFTVEDRSKTKDGPVSINSRELIELVEFSRLEQAEQRRIVEKDYSDWEKLIGYEKREMTHTEMLNRDYYRGRFATKVESDWVYNWEDKPIK